MVRNIKSRIAGKFFSHLVFVILSALCLTPILLLLSVSLSDNGEILRDGYSLIPRGINLEAYIYLSKDLTKIAQAYGITFISTFFGFIGALICTVMLAYSTSRKDFKYRKAVTLIVFFTMLFHAGLFPTYIWITKYLQLKNNILVMIVPGFVTAWYVMLMRSFFEAIPEEIIEAAIVDGCGNMRVLLKIVVPLSKPALATVSLFIILKYFNDWQTSMLYMDSSRVSIQYFLYKTMNNLSEAQNNTIGFSSYEAFPQEPVRMAIAVITVFPVVVLFPFLQKYFVRGITIGSVKG
mgnify:FL=1